MMNAERAIKQNVPPSHPRISPIAQRGARLQQNNLVHESTRIHLAQRSRNQKNRTTDAHRFTLIAKSNPKNLRSLRRF
jgi:hypothetical protein